VIVGDIRINTDDVSPDLLTVVEVQLDDLTIESDQILRIQSAIQWSWVPNESRLSCGALKKKVSFNILRAPAASSAC